MDLERFARTCVNRHMDRAPLIRALRKRLGLTQEAFGELGGLPRTTIAKLESGVNQVSSAAQSEWR